MAPLLGHKASDPAVICLDEAGQSVIPLLGGHQAGANELARQIAAITGGRAAITTASDVQGKPALDQLGQVEGWRIDAASALTHASACLVNDETVGVYLDPALAPIRPQLTTWLEQVDNLHWVESLDALDVDTYAAGLIISHRTLGDHHQHLLRKSVLYRPPVLVAGLGCKRGVPAVELGAALTNTLVEADLALESLAALATVDLKADEPGLHELAGELKLPLQIVSRAQLVLLEPAGFSPSAAQAKFDLPGVAEPCAMLLSGPNGQLVVPKRSFERCTVAIALKG
jgi:cobalt-precorrin 5A hydrolase/precorrin-3B C17-methyltransferase